MSINKLIKEGVPTKETVRGEERRWWGRKRREEKRERERERPTHTHTEPETERQNNRQTEPSRRSFHHH